MEYMPRGWNFFRFILTPRELAQVLEPFHLVQFNCHVPVDYRETPAEEFLTSYRRLYGKLSRGEALSHEADWPLMRHIGLTTDLARCPYGSEHTYEGRQFLLPVFPEPCAALAPFAMTIDPESHWVSLRNSYVQFPQNIVGYEAFYPKEISRGDSAWQSTATLSGYQDFLLLKERISALSRGLRFQLDGQFYRPSVKIGQAAQKDFPRFYAISQFIDK